MKPITLPAKYYLSHARELFDFVSECCSDLLAEEHTDYLAGYERLSEDAQCLLVRFLSRKPRFLARDSLRYPEIDNIPQRLAELQAAGFVSTPCIEDWPQFSSVLTKAMLLECLARSSIKVSSSTTKADLLSLAREYVDPAITEVEPLANAFLVRRKQQVIDYIMFLFFGDLRNRFQKFAMRDLGVLKTRKSKAPLVARFACREQAISSFMLQCRRREFLHNPSELRETTAAYLLSCRAQGASAVEAKDKLLIDVGNAFVDDRPEYAIRLWRESNDPLATERWVRESYRTVDRETLQTELAGMRQQEMPAISKVFIEDFYARKYRGKRTSVFTDMLREQSNKLLIDDSYINDVEQGVIDQYRTQGIDSWFTENRLWRALFAFTFWQLLFERPQKQHSEFDRLPAVLRNHQFYTEQKNEIEQALRVLEQPAIAKQHFIRLASRHYGYPTGVFRWRADLLDSMLPCLELAPHGALAAILRRMAMNYRHTRDGYPDLMVIQHGKLRFEEVKSPGDVLRPNQLVSINRMRRAGLQVDIAQVEWATDPNQAYAVVDIETTGGRRGLHSITEIAVVKVRNQKIIERWSTLINPQRSIPAHISRLTNITDQMVAGAPVFPEIADQLEAQLKDSIFVAHNVGFDYGFIKSAFERMNRPFRKPRYCTVVNARKAFPGLASYSLASLTEHFDIDLHNAHRALSDATATAHLLTLIQQSRANRDQATGQ